MYRYLFRPSGGFPSFLESRLTNGMKTGIFWKKIYETWTPPTRSQIFLLVVRNLSEFFLNYIFSVVIKIGKGEIHSRCLSPLSPVSTLSGRRRRWKERKEKEICRFCFSTPTCWGYGADGQRGHPEMNQTHFLGSFCWQTRTNHQRSFLDIYNPPDTMDQMSITSPTNVICFFLCPEFIKVDGHARRPLLHDYPICWPSRMADPPSVRWGLPLISGIRVADAPPRLSLLSSQWNKYHCIWFFFLNNLDLFM